VIGGTKGPLGVEQKAPIMSIKRVCQQKRECSFIHGETTWAGVRVKGLPRELVGGKKCKGGCLDGNDGCGLARGGGRGKHFTSKVVGGGQGSGISPQQKSPVARPGHKKRQTSAKTLTRIKPPEGHTWLRYGQGPGFLGCRSRGKTTSAYILPSERDSGMEGAKEGNNYSAQSGKV